MKKFSNLVLASLAMATAVAASACGEDSGGDSDDGGGATGGTGPVDGTVLLPSDMGWMDKLDVWNDIGVQGSWYPYGDAYDVAKCTSVGLHSAAECSTIASPLPPPAMGFPNTAGNMCTTGSVAQVLDCEMDLLTRCPHCSGCPMDDFSTMWGAGIGFDLNAEGGTPDAPKHTWDPAAYDITGFSFVIDAPPLPGLRVEIPMQLNDTERNALTPPLGADTTTDDHPDGAPYWGATPQWPNSPVVAGKNCVTWDKINAPGAVPQRYMFDKARMLGVQFHVPTKNSGRGDYSFCISQVTMFKTKPADCPPGQ